MRHHSRFNLYDLDDKRIVLAYPVESPALARSWPPSHILQLSNLAQLLNIEFLL
jgi:hypothetical protein